MYFGTRCASFAGSFEQPTTAIVLISPRIFRICGSSTMPSPERRRASRLRVRWDDAVNRLLQARREIQALRFLGGEPPDFRMFFVRDLRLTSPSGDEEQVVSEEALRTRIDVLIDAEEPRPERRDPQLLLELANQGGRWLFARDEMSPKGVPHPREPNRARALPQEDTTVANDQSRRGDVNHAATKDVLRYAFFFEKSGRR